MISSSINFKALILWLTAVVWMGLIFYLSSIPSFPVDLTDEGYDITSSIVHVVIYFVLAWLFIAALRSSGVRAGRAFFGGFLLAIVYGATDEWHQSFVIGREAHLSDWLLDVAGAYIILSFYTYRHRRKNQLKSH